MVEGDLNINSAGVGGLDIFWRLEIVCPRILYNTISVISSSVGLFTMMRFVHIDTIIASDWFVNSS
jgi:hypothetical protein